MPKTIPVSIAPYGAPVECEVLESPCEVGVVAESGHMARSSFYSLVVLPSTGDIMLVMRIEGSAVAIISIEHGDDRKRMLRELVQYALQDSFSKNNAGAADALPGGSYL